MWKLIVRYLGKRKLRFINFDSDPLLIIEHRLWGWCYTEYQASDGCFSSFERG